jgi:radical SAM superfamily enzyme YgiQ (UPF0313 family)
MSYKVLLLSANRCTAPDPVFPLGLTCLNAALREAGHATHWLDVQVAGDALEPALAQFGPDVVGISLRNIDDVLIRKQETYFGDLTALVSRVRAARSCPVVLGGSGFSVFPKRLLELSGADFGIQGEGEAAFLALLQALETGGDLANVPGLVHRRAATTVVNPPKTGPLSSPFLVADRPARVVAHYLRTGGMLNVQTQRGCAHTCCYCTYPLIEGHAHRRRPPEEIAEDFAQLQAQGARYAFVVDSIFNSTPRHIVETCEAILRRGLALQWGCFLRPQGLTPDLMTLMRRAGLAHAEFGADSFCDAVLAEYGKHFTFEDVLQASAAAHAAGVDYCHFLIAGGPGETPATLEEGYRNSLHLSGAVMMAVVGMRIYPGTALHRRALREGCITPDTDLLPPAYYLAPGLTADGVFAQLHRFTRNSPNWIAGDPVPEYTRLVERLRSRGIVGPLWSYFAMLQRLGPAPATSLTPA